MGIPDERRDRVDFLRSLLGSWIQSNRAKADILLKSDTRDLSRIVDMVRGNDCPAGFRPLDQIIEVVQSAVFPVEAVAGPEFGAARNRRDAYNGAAVVQARRG